MDKKTYAAPKSVSAAWITSVRTQYGLSKAESARMCCVTTNTWQRWEKGEHPMNPCIFHYWLSTLEKRVLPRAGLEGKRWQGWYIENGRLVTPQGEQLTAASIEAQSEQLKQVRSVYRHAHKVREAAANGLADAGESWHGWQFKGGFLISPDERKIDPEELHIVMVGHDAMEEAKTNKPRLKTYAESDVIAIGTKCT